MPNIARPSVADGYKLWREEVEALERPEKEVVYIPIIALAGVYIAGTTNPGLLNSYSWRRSVLDNEDALAGLRASLQSYHRDSVDDTFDIPVESTVPDEDAALQYVCFHRSLIDGMPEDTTTVAENEWFLASTLGYAEHDYSLTFYPLRMAAGGLEALRNNYPRTEAFVSANL